MLIEEAARIGIKPAEFWEMTPLELAAYSKGYAKRETDEYRRIIYGAYITARLGRVKDFPDIEELLSPLETSIETHEQTPEEMLAIIRDFDKQLKGARGETR